MTKKEKRELLEKVEEIRKKLLATEDEAETSCIESMGEKECQDMYGYAMCHFKKIALIDLYDPINSLKY